jgi:hypothetical protein
VTEAADEGVAARRMMMPRDVAARDTLQGFEVELDDLPETGALHLMLRMVAVDRTPFGERFTFRLEP